MRRRFLAATPIIMIPTRDTYDKIHESCFILVGAIMVCARNAADNTFSKHGFLPSAVHTVVISIQRKERNKEGKFPANQIKAVAAASAEIVHANIPVRLVTVRAIPAKRDKCIPERASM